jgi:hypothetical protein
MLRPLALLPLFALAACSAASEPAPMAPKQAGTQPVVIELYQSQGCSSCPPALAVLNQEADRKDVIALNFAVTYWDQLGWKDQFAKPEFTARQWAYARAGGRGNVQTPQLIVQGRAAVLGSRKGEVDSAIASAAPLSGPGLTISGGRVSVGAGKPGNATLWLADYDPRAVAVPIRAGENGGRTLVHRNIVKRLTALGNWRGGAASFALPPAQPGLARAIILQQDAAGPILAARKV